MLENEIIPMYYNKNKKGFSPDWIKVIKNSIATIAPHYTMKRQLDDYYTKFYNGQAKRFAQLSADNNKVAKEIALWKETVAERWDSIRMVSKTSTTPSEGPQTGSTYLMTCVLDEAGLNDAVGLEFVVVKNENGVDKIAEVRHFDMVGVDGNNHTFTCEIEPTLAGSYKVALRMYPKNSLLPHRQDFAYVKWFEA